MAKKKKRAEKKAKFFVVETKVTGTIAYKSHLVKASSVDEARRIYINCDLEDNHIDGEVTSVHEELADEGKVVLWDVSVCDGQDETLEGITVYKGK